MANGRVCSRAEAAADVCGAHDRSPSEPGEGSPRVVHRERGGHGVIDGAQTRRRASSNQRSEPARGRRRPFAATAPLTGASRGTARRLLRPERPDGTECNGPMSTDDAVLPTDDQAEPYTARPFQDESWAATTEPEPVLFHTTTADWCDDAHCDALAPAFSSRRLRPPPDHPVRKAAVGRSPFGPVPERRRHHVDQIPRRRQRKKR